MNPDLDRLQSYPLQKLTALLHGITPNPDLAPISLYIGEPKHPTRMAGHVRFGARTGGALIILGVIIVVIALFFSGSVETIFKIFPAPILGVILFLTGAQLALGSCDFGESKNERFVSIITAACAIWNIGLAFVLGVLTYHLLKRGLIRL